MQWMHCGTYLVQWVSWSALHGQRKRGSISNDELLISLAGSLNVCRGGGSHNEGVNSSDPDLFFLIPPMGIDPSGGTGIYTNTSTKKNVERCSPSLPTFYSYFLAVSKNKAETSVT